mmetsp:Transcript_21309/g.62023  ORF Transcript_21309/g.62023 Transcript_21309/m.62023 type:complete len:88 (-) Transcript_21309:1291-1554(-)
MGTGFRQWSMIEDGAFCCDDDMLMSSALHGGVVGAGEFENHGKRANRSAPWISYSPISLCLSVCLPAQKPQCQCSHLTLSVLSLSIH